MERRNAWQMGTLLAAVTLVLAGCGAGSSASTPAQAGGTSADAAALTAAYDKAIDAQCAASSAFNRALPSLVAKQHLSMDQASARSTQEGERMRAAIARMTPPPALAAAHQQLVADMAKLRPLSTVTLADEIKVLTAMLSDFDRVGARGCASGERGVIKQLQTDSQQLSATPNPG